MQHTREIKHGFQVFGKLQGQLSDGPLVSSEEFSVGGADTVRGYLESEVVADNGIAGTLEVRSPDLGKLLLKRIKKEGGDAAAERAVFSELRFYGFVDGATALTLGSLPDQDPVSAFGAMGSARVSRCSSISMAALLWLSRWWSRAPPSPMSRGCCSAYRAVSDDNRGMPQNVPHDPQ